MNRLGPATGAVKATPATAEADDMFKLDDVDQSKKKESGDAGKFEQDFLSKLNQNQEKLQEQAKKLKRNTLRKKHKKREKGDGDGESSGD